MRHYTAVHVDLGGGLSGWHYASLGSRGGGPLGYCAEHAPHATEQEARECYSHYQRDNIRIDGKTHNWCGCEFEGCDKPTKRSADIRGDGFHMAALCEDHLTVENAAVVMGLNDPAGDAWVS